MGGGAPGFRIEETERDATVFSYHIVMAIHRERERELERRLRFRVGFEEPQFESRLRLRRRLGRGLIRLGRALANDGPRQLSQREPRLADGET